MRNFILHNLLEIFALGALLLVVGTSFVFANVISANTAVEINSLKSLDQIKTDLSANFNDLQTATDPEDNVEDDGVTVPVKPGELVAKYDAATKVITVRLEKVNMRPNALELVVSYNPSELSVKNLQSNLEFFETNFATRIIPEDGLITYTATDLNKNEYDIDKGIDLFSVQVSSGTPSEANFEILDLDETRQTRYIGVDLKEYSLDTITYQFK